MRSHKAVVIFSCCMALAQSTEAGAHGGGDAIAMLFGFMSDPLAMNTAMVGSCAKRYPDSAEGGVAALAGWQQRNTADIPRVQSMVDKEIRAKAQTDAERTSALALLEEIRRRFVDNWEKELDAKGKPACDELLRRLADPSGDLARIMAR